MILTLNFRHNAVRRVEVETVQAAEQLVQEAKNRGYFVFVGEKGQSEHVTASRLETWQVQEQKPRTFSHRRVRPRVASDAAFEEEK